MTIIAWKLKTCAFGKQKILRSYEDLLMCQIFAASTYFKSRHAELKKYSHRLDPFGICLYLSNFKVSQNQLEFIIPPRSHLLSIFCQEQSTLWPDSLRAPMTKAESFRTRHSKAMKPAKIRSFSASHISATDAIGFGWVE